MKRMTVIAPLLVVPLTVLGIVLVRAVNLPSCNVRVGEVCLTRTGDGPAIRGVEVSRQLEMERYAFSFQGPSGTPYELIVVRDDSLGAVEVASRTTARIDTRLWNGTKSSTYIIKGAVPGIAVEVCVESLLLPRCGGGGMLTRLAPYRG